jgi:hypothetical protein
MLEALLKDELPAKFGQTPLRAFANDIKKGSFKPEARMLSECERLMSLLNRREQVASRLAKIEARERNEDIRSRVILDNIFKL